MAGCAALHPPYRGAAISPPEPLCRQRRALHQPLEAGLAGGGMPSSRQLGDWLWNQTALAKSLDVIRRRLMAGDDERSKLVAPFFVPALRVPPD